MNKPRIAALLAGVLLAGCAVAPVPVVYDTPAPKCPPGQARKGNC